MPRKSEVKKVKPSRLFWALAGAGITLCSQVALNSIETHRVQKGIEQRAHRVQNVEIAEPKDLAAYVLDNARPYFRDGNSHGDAPLNSPASPVAVFKDGKTIILNFPLQGVTLIDYDGDGVLDGAFEYNDAHGPFYGVLLRDNIDLLRKNELLVKKYAPVYQNFLKLFAAGMGNVLSESTYGPHVRNQVMGESYSGRRKELIQRFCSSNWWDKNSKWFYNQHGGKK